MTTMQPVGFQHPKGLCYVSDRFRVIFVPIPKNASTSIRNMSDFQFRSDNVMAYRNELATGKYKAFTIIREPISRFIAGYIEICKRACEDSPYILTRDFYWLNGKERFIKFIDEVEREWFDAHIFPQRFFLCDHLDDLFMINAYIEICHLSTAIPVLLRRYGIAMAARVPTLNTHERERVSSIFVSAQKINAKNLRRSFYYVGDYVVRHLQIRHVPTSEEVLKFISDDKSLLARIERLLADDIAFLANLKTSTLVDGSGIYWREN